MHTSRRITQHTKPHEQYGTVNHYVASWCKGVLQLHWCAVQQSPWCVTRMFRIPSQGQQRARRLQEWRKRAPITNKSYVLTQMRWDRLPSGVSFRRRGIPVSLMSLRQSTGHWGGGRKQYGNNSPAELTFLRHTLSRLSCSGLEHRVVRKRNFFSGARSSVVGWGTVLQAQSSIPDEVTGFFSCPNHSSRIVALGWTQPLTKMSTKNIPEDRTRPVRKADIAAICEPTC
jgi:hypothetical protein